MLDPVGMTNGKLDRSAGAGGNAHRVDLVDIEMVQQRDKRVGLHCTARVLRQRRPEVTTCRAERISKRENTCDL